jgi:DNA (cytosine-5)-methyltransferase 1
VKVLNLYAGIGGNRKLWEDVEVTAVELDPKIAAIYQDFFPEDKVIVADAHEYLLQHFKEFDFIWSSPPCPSHSRLNIFAVPLKEQNKPGGKELEYPNMKLYEEILLLKHWSKSKWVIENVIPYYEPLIKAQEHGRHLWWSNFHISSFDNTNPKISHKEADTKYLQEYLGFNLSGYIIQKDKRQILRNCVQPELGKHILDCARSKALF